MMSVTATPVVVCGLIRTGRHSIARSSQNLLRTPGGSGSYSGPQHPAAALLRSPAVVPLPSVSWSSIQRPLATSTTTKTTKKKEKKTTKTKKKPVTPLHQAAQDAREEAERRELETRIRNAEQNEHIPAPGGEYDVDGAIDIIANRKIRHYMMQQQQNNNTNTNNNTSNKNPGNSREGFGLAHRSGDKLAARRPVGDILGNAGYVPVWVELQQQIATMLHNVRTGTTTTTTGTGEGSSPTDTTTNSNTAAAGTISDEELSELRALQHKYNQRCPPTLPTSLSNPCYVVLPKIKTDATMGRTTAG